jgi:hypothetical protein
MWARLFLTTWDDLQPKHDVWADLGVGLAGIVAYETTHRQERPRLQLADIPADAPGMLGLVQEHLVREHGQGEG